MSKGWTRRPSAVDRKAFDAAYERIFSRSAENGAVIEENGVVPPYGDSPGPKPTPAFYLGPDGCQIADVMTQGFHDQRSRA